MKEDEEVVIDSSTSLLIETLEKRWKTYRSELKRCHKEPSEEAIHDFRVATRRLLALVDMLREVSPHPRLGKLRRIFLNQLDGLDDLRDTQVMLVEVTETLGDLPELAPFQEYLTKREKRLLRSTTKEIKTFKSGRVRPRIDSARKALFKTEDENFQRKTLLQIVDDAYETSMRRFRRIETAQPGTIHRFRVAFKKFRYMVETVHPLVKDFPEDNLKHLHDYQGILGDIQDVDMILSTFDEFMSRDDSYNPEPVRRFYQQRHTEVVNAFVEDMHLINTFWRPDLESPFPWNAGQSQQKTTTLKVPASLSSDQERDGDKNRIKVELPGNLSVH